MDKLYYTGVGSRATPPHILKVMTAIAKKMAFLTFILRSGGAIGADLAFEAGATEVLYAQQNGLIEGNLIQPPEIFYSKDATPEARAIAGQFHPAWNAFRKDGSPVVSDYAKNLHGRNAFQVLGRTLDIPSKYCICWTPDGCLSHATRTQLTGGTGTAISIASHYGVPVVNLQNPEHLIVWEEWAYA